MRVDDFAFDLPESLIALRPARPRDSARLLHVAQDGALSDLIVRDALSCFQPGDVMVFNDTRVIPAALTAVRPARAADGADVSVHINLHKRTAPDTWLAFAKPGKRLALDDRLVIAPGFEARVAAKQEAGDVALQFDRAGPALDATIAAYGAPPLPPYIAQRRPADADDVDDYQTVYAAHDGSVAAPTAGFHFTPALLDGLDAMGVERVSVTLHVGAGTFLPVKSDDTDDHVMHAEWREVDADAAARINQAKSEGRRVIAVGTTALRTLESAAKDGLVQVVAGETDLFIAPGFNFQLADGLWTNFHLPRSTLFMLVCGFAGTDRMKRAYDHAVARAYRFYSYGDASLLWLPRG